MTMSCTGPAGGATGAAPDPDDSDDGERATSDGAVVPADAGGGLLAVGARMRAASDGERDCGC